MKVCCDTNSLFHNIDRHREQEKERLELDALISLLDLHKSGVITLYRTRVVRAEIARTTDSTQRAKLERDYSSLEQIPKDEAIVGHSTITSYTGGFVHFAQLSDILNENVYRELIEIRKMTAEDAHHVTHAVENQCDVFLTRDEKTIIRPHREWLEQRFPGLKIRRPSELLAEICAQGQKSRS